MSDESILPNTEEIIAQAKIVIEKYKEERLIKLDPKSPHSLASLLQELVDYSGKTRDAALVVEQEIQKLEKLITILP